MIHAVVDGNIGREPELKQVGQTSVLEFSVASSFRSKVNGQYEKQTAWVRCSVWGKRGDALVRLLGKGSHVIVRGEAIPRTYTDKTGAERTAWEIPRADDVSLGPKRDRQQTQHHESKGSDWGGDAAGDSGSSPVEDEIPF